MADGAWTAESGDAMTLYGNGNFLAGCLFGKSGADTLDCVIRFDNVTIPAGALISSASLDLCQYYSGGDVVPVDVKVYCNDVDDAAQVTSKSQFEGLALTSSYASWYSEEEWEMDEWYTSVDISSILQEVIDRPGWSSGNAISIVIKESDSTGRRYPYYYELGFSPPNLPELSADWGEGIVISSPADVDVNSYDPSVKIDIPIPVASVNVVARNPSQVWEITPDKTATAQAIFKCVLTGAPDGLDDLEIPIASFQSRMRDGDPSYLSCTIKNSLEYSDEVAARSNGEIVIYKGFRFADGTEQLEEINRVDYEHCIIDRGANSDTMSIVGHKTTSSSGTKEWTVSNLSFYGLQSDGKRRIRADMDLFLRVGDTCIYGEGGNDYFIVGMITYWAVAIPATLFMEVLEA